MSCLAWLLLLVAPDYARIDFGTTAARRVKLLKHENAGVRSRAAMLLAHAPPDQAIAGLLVALGDPSAAVRRAAASSLARLGDERAVPFLARRAREEAQPVVKAAMIVALGRCGKSYVARHVQPYLEHPDRTVRAAAASALGSVGDAGQRAALWAALRYAPNDPGFVVRSAVLRAFVQLGWHSDVRRAVGELEKMGARRHWVSRVAIAGAVGAAGMKERAGWLKQQLEREQDPRVVAAAASSLGRLGLLDEVLAATRHAAPDVRRAALVALQEHGDRRAAQRAREMVQDDPDGNVRFEAALILHQASDPAADAYLVDALRSRDPLFWITALAALEGRHKRSFGRDPKAWTKFLKSKG